MRGQLQTLEPIIIVIMLAIIIGLSLLFYVRITHVEDRREASRISTEEDFTTLARIVDLPELSCSRAGTAKTYCIDKYKAEAFAQLQSQDTRLYYTPFFGAADIKLTYLDGGTPVTLTLYENLDSTHVTQTRTFFTVLDPITNVRMFAVLTIERERR